MESLERQLQKEIKTTGIKKKTIEQWSKDAELHDWYLSAYSLFSDSVHSKVNDLERYLVLNEKNELIKFRWGPSDHQLEKILATLIEGMLKGLNCTRALFRQKEVAVMTNYRERLNALVKERLHNDE